MMFIKALVVLILSTTLFAAKNESDFFVKGSKSAIVDFSGKIVPTKDSNWQKEWAKPRGEIPYIQQANEVTKSDELSILIFFAGAKADYNGKLNIQCDIEIIKADKSIEFKETNLDCFSDVIKGNPNDVYLSKAILNFKAAPKDPLGNWIINVSLRDINSGSKVNLKSEFKLK